MSDPVFDLIPLCAMLAVSCWALSVITREYSWVDRLWSVAPLENGLASSAAAPRQARPPHGG